MTFGSAARFNATVSAAVDAIVSGRVRSGAGQTLGDVVLSQSVTVRANATAQVTAATIPAGAEVVDIDIKSLSAFGTAGADINMLFGVAGNDVKFGTISNVSGRTGSLIGIGTPSGKGMHRVSALSNVMVKTTAVSGAHASATNAGLKFVTVRYRRGG